MTAVPVTTLATKLVARSIPSGWPSDPTVGELAAFATRRLGKRYAGVWTKVYGGGTQVEVIANKSTYDGFRERVIKATYLIAN